MTNSVSSHTGSGNSKAQVAAPMIAMRAGLRRSVDLGSGRIFLKTSTKGGSGPRF
jgi:hypothetical protein